VNENGRQARMAILKKRGDIQRIYCDV